MTGANMAILEAYATTRAHSGWKEDEEEMLWAKVAEARKTGKPLKSVFDLVAKETGRKPNSIRNYYYARARDNDLGNHNPSFISFTQEEIWDLLVTVLKKQAEGVSVRATTLEMGKGDTKAMLRYQNKYRALIKSNPALVKEVVNYMRENAIPTIDPYATISKGAGRPRKESGEITPQELLSGVAQLVKQARELEDAKRQIETLTRQLYEMKEAR